jgi:hypothetical protein
LNAASDERKEQNAMTILGENAFKNRADLTSIVIPEGVTTIGTLAFASCESLVSIFL